MPDNHTSTVDQLLTEYEQLLDRRAQLLSEHASTWAKFGFNGTATLRRNIEEARLRQKFRHNDGIGSEQHLKDEVACSPRWNKVVDALEEGRRLYFQQKAELEITATRLGLLSARIRLAGLSLADIPGADAVGEDAQEGR